MDFKRLYFFTLQLRFLCSTYQTERLIATALFAYGGQETGIRSDHTVILTAHGVCKVYPGCIAESELTSTQRATSVSKFLTNNFEGFKM